MLKIKKKLFFFLVLLVLMSFGCIEENNDTQKPVITLKGEEKIEIYEGDDFVDPGATAIDNVDGDISDKIDITGVVNTSKVGTYTLRYSVKDQAGNVSEEMIRVINVKEKDKVKPIIELNGDALIELFVGDVYLEEGAKASDNVDGILTDNIIIEGSVDTSKVGEYIITYKIKDKTGNENQITRKIIVKEKDTEKPTIELNGEALLELFVGDVYLEEGANATDNIDGIITDDIMVEGNVDTNKVGEYIITYKIKDNAGNENQITRKIIVKEKDVINPVIVLNGLNIIEINKGDNFVDPGAKASDNIDGELTDKIIAKGTVNINVPGEYEIIYTVTDNAGNSDELVRKVVVKDIDTTLPELELNGDSIIELNVGVDYIEEGAKAFDDFDGEITESITVSGDVDVNTEGTYKITYKITDKAGNTNQIVREVIVKIIENDEKPPTLKLIGDDKIVLEFNDIYVEKGATAFDNVNGDLSDKIKISGEVNTKELGEYIIKYEVSDTSGNKSNAERKVEVKDTTLPVITLLNDEKLIINKGIKYKEFGALAEDNYDGDLTDKIIISGEVDSTKEGNYTISYEVSDSSGNITIIKRTVIVMVIENDNEPPKLELLGESEISIILGENFEDPGAISFDNVDGDISDKIIVEGLEKIDGVGEYEILYKSKDSSGNESKKTRIVKVLKKETNENAEIFIKEYSTYINSVIDFRINAKNIEKINGIQFILNYNINYIEFENSDIKLLNSFEGGMKIVKDNLLGQKVFSIVFSNAVDITDEDIISIRMKGIRAGDTEISISDIKIVEETTNLKELKNEKIYTNIKIKGSFGKVIGIEEQFLSIQKEQEVLISYLGDEEIGISGIEFIIGFDTKKLKFSKELEESIVLKGILSNAIKIVTEIEEGKYRVSIANPFSVEIREDKDIISLLLNPLEIGITEINFEYIRIVDIEDNEIYDEYSSIVSEKLIIVPENEIDGMILETNYGVETSLVLIDEIDKIIKSLEFNIKTDEKMYKVINESIDLNPDLNAKLTMENLSDNELKVILDFNEPREILDDVLLKLDIFGIEEGTSFIILKDVKIIDENDIKETLEEGLYLDFE